MTSCGASDFSTLPATCVGPTEGSRPLFSWRGLMIDSARTRFSVDTMITVIELAKRYGFSHLHWHLTDDAGWRFRVPSWPKLETVAATLPRDDFKHYDCLAPDTLQLAAQAEKDGRWSAGCYTDEEIAKVVQAAKTAGITVVPEVDLPGHMMAAITAYPTLGKPEDVELPQTSVRENMFWAARNDLLWPTDEAASFVSDVLDRVVELFPDSPIHIGGDECAYLQWEADPNIGEWLRLRHLNKVPEIQTWFFDLAFNKIRSHGRDVICWDEVASISDNPDVALIAWDESRGLERIASTANPFIFADARTLYLNRIDPSSQSPQKGMVPGITVDDILQGCWTFLAEERCIGLETCLWSEFVFDKQDIFSMLFPRVLAVAERMWTRFDGQPDRTTHPDPVEAKERVDAEYKVLAKHLQLK